MAENKRVSLGWFHPTQKGAPYITPFKGPPWWVRVDCRGSSMGISRSYVFQGFSGISLDSNWSTMHSWGFFFPIQGHRDLMIWGLTDPHANRTIKHGFTSGVMTGWMFGMFWLFEGKLQFCSTVWPVAGCFLMEIFRNISGVPPENFLEMADIIKHGWYLESWKVNPITDPCMVHVHVI